MLGSEGVPSQTVVFRECAVGKHVECKGKEHKEDYPDHRGMGMLFVCGCECHTAEGKKVLNNWRKNYNERRD